MDYATLALARPISLFLLSCIAPLIAMPLGRSSAYLLPTRIEVMAYFLRFLQQRWLAC